MNCKKFIEVDSPPTSLNQVNVFTSDISATQVLTGFYADLSNENINGNVGNLGALYLSTALSADELSYFGQPSGLVSQIYTNSLNQSNAFLWSNIYLKIFRVNLALEALAASNSLLPTVKHQLEGEAKFFRAFNYFYLVNLFGDVPLALSSDPEINRLLPRTSKEVVYRHIISDLNDAKDLLSSDFLNASLKITTERTRPTKWAAEALLSRTYLYHGDYEMAEQISSDLINQGRFELLPELKNVFLMNSRETIWSIQPVRADATNGYNTGEGKLFILPSSGPNNQRPFFLSKSLMDNFEPGDLRKSKWTDSVSVNGKTYNFPRKYSAAVSQTSLTEYSVVFRIGEQYLIRAEARARQGQNKFLEAVADLNTLRNRSRANPSGTIVNPLPVIGSNISQADLFKLIEKERFSELFTEWGHRWLDLKRTPGFNNQSITRADEIMPIATMNKGGSWDSNWKLYPIPASEFLLNPSLTGHQNPGY